MNAPEVRVVWEWHEALNAGDVDRLMALSSPGVEVGGPRGTGHGAELLGEWVARSGISIEPRKVFHRAGTVVAGGEARWRDAETGEINAGQSVASVFVVRDGLVARVVRYPDLASALLAAGMDEADELRQDG